MTAHPQGPVFEFNLDGLDTAKLFIYFRGHKRQEDLTVFIANLARSAIAKVFPPPSSVGGLAAISGGLDTAQRVHAAHQAHQLYYCVLQHVLQKLNPLYEVMEGRFQRNVIPEPEESHRMLRTPDFHLGLLTCSLELVSAAVFQQHVPLSTPVKIDFESSMLSVWDAAGWFLDCFDHEGRAGKPSMSASGIAYLNAIKSRCEEELVLADGSHFYEIFFTGGGSLYAGGTTTLISSFIASLGHSGIQRTMAAAHQVAAHNMSGLPVPAADFIVACADLMDEVLMQRLDLLFGKHVGMLIICCIYGVAKVLGATLGFRSVALQVFDMFPDGNIIGQAKLQDKQQELLVTNARSFYNTIFLNACDHLVRKSAKFASSGVVAGAEGPEVGSEGPHWAASDSLPTASIRFIHQSSVAVMKRTAPAKLPAEQGDLEMSVRKADVLS